MAERSLERLASWDEADWAQAYSQVQANLRMSETLLLQVDLGLLEESAMEALGYSLKSSHTFLRVSRRASSSSSSVV